MRTAQDLSIYAGVPQLIRTGDTFGAMFTLRNGSARPMLWNCQSSTPRCSLSRRSPVFSRRKLTRFGRRLRFLAAKENGSDPRFALVLREMDSATSTSLLIRYYEFLSRKFSIPFPVLHRLETTEGATHPEERLGIE